MNETICFFSFIFYERRFAHPPCGDFLKQHGKKPKHLEFVKCIKEQDRQIPTLVATYRVKGKYASEVEKYCIDTFGMQPLQEIFCIWEPMPNSKGERYGSLESGWNGFYYTIDMGADSSVSAHGRKGWPEIEWFIVTVELPLERP
ncbi:DUF4952 domain-containing protein [Leptospira santarosai]|uniref:DUF4952 domain-containing protein n=1 Tax=Leptospira santarosai TaxID=28183 RepID=UPI0002BD6E80|nr:DUF4952 domain-containing protein [Leptospira santarosai]EMO83885.1 hypothetical protein LEP1GSC070_0533 [Leptospira santarosai str. AIM]